MHSADGFATDSVRCVEHKYCHGHDFTFGRKCNGIHSFIHPSYMSVAHGLSLHSWWSSLHYQKYIPLLASHNNNNNDNNAAREWKTDGVCVCLFRCSILVENLWQNGILIK